MLHQQADPIHATAKTSLTTVNKIDAVVLDVKTNQITAENSLLLAIILLVFKLLRLQMKDTQNCNVQNTLFLIYVMVCIYLPYDFVIYNKCKVL